MLDTICSTFEMVSSVFADEDTFYCYARQLPTGDWCEYIYVTPATIRDFPYFEDFSSAYANNEFPDGWIVLEGNDMFPHISHHSFNYRSGNRGSLYFNASEGYNRVVLPYIITDTLSNYELCFNYYNSYSPAWLNVGLMSDSNGVKEYEVLRSVDIGSASSTPSSDVWRNWNTMYINLPNSSDKRHIFFSVSSSSSEIGRAHV